MISIEPKDLSPAKLQSYLQGAVAPRPIAFASTMSKKGKPNSVSAWYVKANQKERSVTFSGIARAMVEQWG